MQNNLEDVRKRMNTNTPLISTTTPLSNHPKFKPATAITRPSASLASFSTPGFSKQKQIPSTNPIKRTSSNSSADVSSDPSPASKRFRSATENKENQSLLESTSGEIHVEKATNDSLPRRTKRSKPQNPYHTDDDSWKKFPHDDKTDPWESIDRDFPHHKSGPAPNNPSLSLDTAYPDLHSKSSESLRSLLAFNHASNSKNNDAMLAYYLDTKSADIVTLEAIKDILDRRIQAIQAAISTRDQSASTDEPVPPVQATSSTSTVQGQHSDTFSDDIAQIRQTEDDDDAYWATVDEIAMDEWPGQTTPSVAITSALSSIAKITSTVTTSVSSRVDHTASTYYPDLIRTLKDVFKLQTFRRNQLEAMTATMSSLDVFVLMPTGGGKSLCFQVPAVCQSDKVTIVISPLLSLMEDQVESLTEKGIDAVLWNSATSSDDAERIGKRLSSSNGGRKPCLVYVTPEKLKESHTFRGILRRLYDAGELARFVIDEAHCISSWGRDFREAYLSLTDLRNDYPKTPIIALTATAKHRTVEDIIYLLKMREPVRLTQSFNRPNLFYDVRTKPRNNATLLSQIASWINSHHRDQCGVIFCLSRSMCENVAKDLRDKYALKARHYHASLEDDEKKRTQRAWRRGECRIIVATIAFGMGIDKADVRFVIHHSMPKSLDGYYQETGRAGRDGIAADCILYYSYNDAQTLIRMMREPQKGKIPSPEDMRRLEEGVRSVVQYCQNDVSCRRTQVLSYFNEDFDSSRCGQNCNNCMHPGEVVEQDMSKHAVDAIELVKEAGGGSYTQNHFAQVFKGANTKEIKEKGHDKLKLHGAGSDLSKEVVERLFGELMLIGAFKVVSVQNRSGWSQEYVDIGPKANEVLSGRRGLSMPVKIPNIKSSGSSAESKKPRRQASKATNLVNKSTEQWPPPRRKKVRVPQPPDETEEPVDLYDDDDEESPIEAAIEDDAIEVADDGKPSAGRSARTGRHPAAVPDEEDDNDFAKLVKRLQEVRRQVCEREELGRLEDVLDDTALAYIGAMCPTDPFGFEEGLRLAAGETMTKTEVEDFVKIKTTKFSKDFLKPCLLRRQGQSAGIVKSTTFDATTLHQQFDYKGELEGKQTRSRYPFKVPLGIST